MVVHIWTLWGTKSSGLDLEVAYGPEQLLILFPRRRLQNPRSVNLYDSCGFVDLSSAFRVDPRGSMPFLHVCMCACVGACVCVSVRASV